MSNPPRPHAWIVPGPDRPTPNAVPVSFARATPPTRYATGHGRFAELPPDRHGPWPEPKVMYTPDGSRWEEDPWRRQQTRWVPLGWMPWPRTRLGMATYNIAHGRMMGYPWLAVLRFALRGLRAAPPAPTTDQQPNLTAPKLTDFTPGISELTVEGTPADSTEETR